MVLLAVNLGLVTAMMLAVWVRSVRKEDASIIDSFWGPGFGLVALVTAVISNGFLPRRILLTALTVVWGVRLSAHIARRNRGKGEDVRYRAMRARHGERFAWVSLFTVFLLQAALLWFISLPVQVGVIASSPARFTGLDLLGSALWGIGFAFEAVADWQLARFKSDPANAGKVLDSGLWRYSRHPNYFGDAVLWWGLFTVAAATPMGPWTVASPLLMTWLLRRVSGVPLLEDHLRRTRPDYARYVHATSPFFPWPPRDRASRKKHRAADPPTSEIDRA